MFFNIEKFPVMHIGWKEVDRGFELLWEENKSYSQFSRARVVNIWNSLNEKAVPVETMNTFKSYLGELCY